MLFIIAILMIVPTLIACGALQVIAQWIKEIRDLMD